ncbi:MAG: carbohydrate-binding family 9-like protein [Candidatus Sumerlaeia bacterium]
MRRLAMIFMLGCFAASAMAAGETKAPKPPKPYTVKYAKIKPEFKGDWAAYWNSPAWKQANTVTVDQWSTASTETRPGTQVRVLYDETGVRLLWKVEDTYVVAKARKFLDPVSRDSCVEFFFEPAKHLGYLNLETNAGGTMLWRVQKPVRDQDVNVTYPPKYQRPPLSPPEDIGLKVQVRKSIPRTVIDPPIETPTTWYIESFIPIEVLNYAFGIKPEDLSGASWRGNFYKIIESRELAIAAHRHYGAWSSIGSKVNFHQPAIFGQIKFEKTPKTNKKTTPRRSAD